MLPQDNQEEATIGAFLFHELMQRVSESEDLDNEIDEILQDFEIKCKRPILHSVLFYWLVATASREQKLLLSQLSEVQICFTTSKTKEL